jgi:hypothetical protein
MEKVTSADGTVIAFDQLGSGPPLVLVAGASCDRAADQHVAQGLAEHFTVLNYDRRGRGDSTDTPPYTVDREMEDLDAVLDAAGGSAVVVGLSSGAALAGLAAAQRRTVSHLVLWEPPFRLDPEGQRAGKQYASALTTLLDAGEPAEALALFLRTVGIPDETIAGMRQSPYWSTGVAMAHTLAYDAAVLGSGAVPVERFARVGAATLAMAGGASPGWMRQAARKAAESIPGATYRELPGQTHDVSPTVLADAVREFVIAYGGR